MKNLQLFLRTHGYNGPLSRFWIIFSVIIVALILSVGSVVVVQDTLRSRTAPVHTTESFSLNGSIQSMMPDEWIVQGVQVTIDQQTHIDGTPAIGSQAAIQGIMLDDGTLLARTVTIQSPPTSAVPPAPTGAPPATTPAIPVLTETPVPQPTSPPPPTATILPPTNAPPIADDPFTALRMLLTQGISEGRIQDKAGQFLSDRLDKAQQAAGEGKANQLQKPLRDMEKRIREEVRNGAMDADTAQQLVDGISRIGMTYAAQPPGDEGKPKGNKDEHDDDD